jgi:MinD-like ATPase involved in chromosome partitioning or flagellar assembly
VLIALCSAKGAPGVTTSGLALTLSWPRGVVLAELDPAGGDVLAGYGRAELTVGGLAELELAARHDGLAGRLDAHFLQLDTAGRARLLPGLADPATARHVDWERLAAALASVEDGAVDVVADCGRLRAEHFPAAVLRRAAVVVVVTGSTLRAVRAAAQTVAELRREGNGPGWQAGALAAFVVGPGEPYGEREIGEALGIPVVGVLPRDAKAAAVLSDGAPAGRLFTQSALLRAARSAAVRLVEFAAAHEARLTPPPATPAASAATVGGGRGR